MNVPDDNSINNKYVVRTYPSPMDDLAVEITSPTILSPLQENTDITASPNELTNTDTTTDDIVFLEYSDNSLDTHPDMTV
jgi:hypothetical protein